MLPETTPTKKATIPALIARIVGPLRRHTVSKLGAVLIAIIFWAVVIASDPALEIEKSFPSAAVTVQGVETLRSRGYTVVTDLTSQPLTVRMRVEVTQSNYARATAESFSPRLDLSQITGAGLQRVRIAAAYSTYGTVVSFDPEYVEVMVEPYTTNNRVPVVIEMTGENAAPLWIDTPLPDPAQVTVSGPQSLVDQVKRAVAPLPLNSLSIDRTQDSLSAPLILQDGSGNPVDTSQLRITSESVGIQTVRIDVDVYPTRDIPIDTQSAVVGAPAHGYQVSAVRISPKSVNVAATAEVLDAMEAAFLQTPIDVSGLSAGVARTVSLAPMPAAEHRVLNEVTVEVDIVPAEHVHTYGDLPVTVMGLSPGLTARLNQSAMSAVIRGLYPFVEGLSAESIHLYVDATGLTAGVYTAEVGCRVDGVDEYAFEPEWPMLTLTLTEAPAPTP
jgi:YbbR domain-containing protein